MIQTIFAVLGVSIATWTDLKTKKIPNWLTFSLIVIGLILNSYFKGIFGLRDSFFGLGLGILLLYLPFAMGGVGAGDVKLLAAIGSLLGPKLILSIFLFSAVFGGIFSLVAMIRAKSAKNVFHGVINRTFCLLTKSALVEQPMDTHTQIGIPYACAILAGTLFVLFVLKGG